MALRYAWGIDVGESAIKAVKLRRSRDSIVVQEFHTIPCEARAEDGQAGDRELRVRNALSELQFRTRLKGYRIAVSVPGREVFPRFIPLPPVEKKRIPEIVRYEARTQMPFPMEEVVWDYQPVTGLDVPGQEVEVAFFAIKKATVYGFLTNLRLAGLTPDIVELSPLATYNFLLHDQDVTTATVAVDVGAGSTDLVVIDGERFWTRSVAISGNDITRALQEKYQISFEEAENLKRKAATSTQADKLFIAMRPIVDDLIGEIQRSIGYYKAQTRNVRIERVVLLGNAFRLPQLVKHFQESLDYDVVVLGRLNRMRVSTLADGERFEAELPTYAVAVGLALQALGVARVKIDMMPRELRRERILRQKVPYAAAILALLAAPVGIGYHSATRELSSCQAEIEPIGGEINKYKKELDRERELSQLGKVGEQLNLVGTLGQERSEWLHLLDTINRAVNKLQREPFRLNGIRELTQADLTGMAGAADTLGARIGTRPQMTLAGGLKIEVRFEKDSEFSPEDIKLLLSKLEEQEYVREVQGRQPERLTELSGRWRGDSGSATAAAGQGWVYTFWLTFSTKPLQPQAAAPGPAPKAAPKAPKPASTRTAPKRQDDLRRID